MFEIYSEKDPGKTETVSVSSEFSLSEIWEQMALSKVKNAAMQKKIISTRKVTVLWNQFTEVNERSMKNKNQLLRCLKMLYLLLTLKIHPVLSLHKKKRILL